jgi:hypothetical protein
MSKEGFEAIQIRFDETGLGSELVYSVRGQEAVVTEGAQKKFKKKDSILAPNLTKPGYSWVAVASPFTGFRRDDLERIQGLTPFQTPEQITAWDKKHQSYKTLPEGTIFGAYVRPDRKKR